MTKSITVVRWIDDRGIEHTTRASAEYDDARFKVKESLEQLAAYGQISVDDILEWIATEDQLVKDYIAKIRTFRVETGRVVGKHSA